MTPGARVEQLFGAAVRRIEPSQLQSSVKYAESAHAVPIPTSPSPPVPQPESYCSLSCTEPITPVERSYAAR